MRNYFVFDGIDSRDFGVYISGQGTFKSPARSYDAIQIPGKNGALLGDFSRLENVELTYPAFIYSNFATNLANFRAFLLSHTGYFKLSDSYHPGEYRLAYFPGPIEPNVTSANNAGSFDITFVCKPQRFLNSGDIVSSFTPDSGNQRTYTGDIVTFEAEDGDAISSLKVSFDPIQDMHGYDSPWPAGGGKNLTPFNTDYTPTAGVNNGVVQLFTLTLPAGTYTYSCKQSKSIPTSTRNTLSVVIGSGGYTYESTSVNYNPSNLRHAQTFTLTEERTCVFYIWEHTPSEAATFSEWQVEKSASFTGYSPYSNICPISGRTGLSVYVGPDSDPDNATEYAVDWQTEAGTVYGATLQYIGGRVWKLRVDRAIVTYSSSTGFAAHNSNRWYHDGLPSGADYSKRTQAISNCATYSDSTNTCKPYFAFGSSGVYVNKLTQSETIDEFDERLSANPMQICYYLATPIEYTLTAQEMEALVGVNNVWSDSGPVEVVITDAIAIVNPTSFPSQPLLRVYGEGSLKIGSNQITITDANQYTDIDCEMMDCFKGVISKNQYVQFSTNDFPTLEPGRNRLQFNGITKVDIKPRWWSV